MNFFQRRKILQNINYLDLTPVRIMDFRLTDDGKIDILLPRFKSSFLANFTMNSKKGEYIYIHLDKTGSLIWNCIDGYRNVHSICNEMNEEYSDIIHPPEETERRVTQFLSMLYQERYISFREILQK